MLNRTGYFVDYVVKQSVPGMFWQAVGLTLSYPYQSN